MTTTSKLKKINKKLKNYINKQPKMNQKQSNIKIMQFVNVSYINENIEFEHNHKVRK